MGRAIALCAERQVDPLLIILAWPVHPYFLEKVKAHLTTQYSIYITYYSVMAGSEYLLDHAWIVDETAACTTFSIQQHKRFGSMQAPPHTWHGTPCHGLDRVCGPRMHSTRVATRMEVHVRACLLPRTQPHVHA